MSQNFLKYSNIFETSNAKGNVDRFSLQGISSLGLRKESITFKNKEKFGNDLCENMKTDTNNEIVGISSELNKTYEKKENSNDELEDEKIKEVIDDTNSKSVCDSIISDTKVCKRRDSFNIFNKFDTFNWSTTLSDLKIDSFITNASAITDDCPMIIRLRNYLAEYQEVRGITKEEYNFSALIKTMGHATGQCLLALFYVIINILPILEIFVHILRFVFDKLIDIKNTPSAQQIIIKTAVFTVELLCIYICLIFMFGFIVSPVVKMAFGIFKKIMLYD